MKIVVYCGRKMHFWARRIFETTPEGPPLLQGTPVELTIDPVFDGTEFYMKIVREPGDPSIWDGSKVE